MGNGDTRNNDHFEGGVEYRPSPHTGQVFRPNGPPAQNYPVEVESNNAMANQPAVDHSWTGVWAPQHIVGRARLIIAKKVTPGILHHLCLRVLPSMDFDRSLA